MQRSGPLVTIGIPFLNPGEAFRDAIRSLFAQDYTNWEAILVDDGSQDGSLELAKRIEDPRVRVVSDGRNLGLAARLNQITTMAAGEYIARMDADDIMHPERLSRQVAQLVTHPSIDVISTGAFFMDAEGKIVGVRIPSRTPPHSLHQSIREQWLVHGSVMAKREWCLANPYNPLYKRGEERELFFRSFYATRFAVIPEPLYGWRFVGTHTLRKYLTTFKYERRLLLEHGPRLLGWKTTLSRLGFSLVKSLATMALFGVGLGEMVQKRAYTEVEPSLLEELTDTVAQIRRQSVPGW